jgi:hypothetical protein
MCYNLFLASHKYNFLFLHAYIASFSKKNYAQIEVKMEVLTKLLMS